MAHDINSLVIIGRLTRDLGSDPNGKDFAYLQNGTARANVSIAVNRSRKQADGSWADETSFIDVTIWGKTAENLKPYLVKGQQIAVCGFLKQDRWQDQQGNNRSRLSVVDENVQLLGGRKEQQADTWQQGKQQYQQQKQQQQAAYVQNGMVQQQQQGFVEDIPWAGTDPIPF